MNLSPSKLIVLQTCPRKYFFSHVLNWMPERISHHLLYGTAVHKAMEVIMCERGTISNEDLVVRAYDAFYEEYRKYFSFQDDQVNAPKNPENTLNLIAGYVKRYADDQFKTLYTEVIGTVNVTEEDTIRFKMDSIVEDRDGVYAMEHKTTSMDSRSWDDEWPLSLQVGTYIHALYCLYPPEQVVGLKIDGLIVRKMGNAYKRITIRKSMDQMAVWYWEVKWLLEFLRWNMASLEECSENDLVLKAFPMNTTACVSKYGTCPYHGFCMAWSNPLARCAEPPPGFILRESQEEPHGRFVMTGTKIVPTNGEQT